MRKLALLAVPLALVVCAVVADAQVTKADGWHVGTKNTPVRLGGPVYFDSTAASSTNDGGAGITFSGRGTVVYDFPALSGASAALDTVCAESSAGTAQGCRFGDTVFLGVDQALVNAFGTINAYISASDAFKVRACAVGITDGGSFNMPDASYTVRCVR